VCKIDDAGDPGVLENNGRHTVQTSEGVLYSMIIDGTDCEMYSSSDGSSWTLEDSISSCNTDLAIAIDSNDLIHVAYKTSTPDLRYDTFNTQ